MLFQQIDNGLAIGGNNALRFLLLKNLAAFCEGVTGAREEIVVCSARFKARVYKKESKKGHAIAACPNTHKLGRDEGVSGCDRRLLHEHELLQYPATLRCEAQSLTSARFQRFRFQDLLLE